MSDQVKDKELKKLTKELLQRQVQESQAVINAANQQIARLQDQVQQQIGVLNYANHLLAGFEIPNEPKPEAPKKPELEVK